MWDTVDDERGDVVPHLELFTYGLKRRAYWLGGRFIALPMHHKKQKRQPILEIGWRLLFVASPRGFEPRLPP